MNTGLEEQHNLILEQFKSRIEDCNMINYSDIELEKWLIVYNYNVNDADQALRKTLKWRKINKLDELLNSDFEFPEAFNKYFSLGSCGYDKFKCPIWISAFGRIDLKGLVQCVSKKDLSQVIRYIMETAVKEMRVKEVDKVSAVIDMENLSMNQICNKRGLEVIFELVSTLETHYPHRVRKAFIINSQAVLQILFNIVKPFINKTTVEAIFIYGTDKEEWTSALLAEIDSDQLPAYYGGTLTDSNGDPKCPHLFNMGGQVPKQYYLSNNLPVRKEGMDLITIIAGVGGFKKLKFKVSIVNSILSWEFMSEGGDLAYYVYCKSRNEGTVDLVPLDRVDSHLNMEIGQITCEKAGKYVFVFDNTFSYVQVKKVHYKIQIEPPSKIDVISSGRHS